MTLLIERRRPAFAPELLVRVGLAWTMICALLLVTNLPQIAGGGAPVIGSKLADLPLAGLVLLLAPVIGQVWAENVAVVVIPMLTFGAALLLAGRIAWRVIGDEAAGLACLAMALSVPVIAQMRPLSVDDGGWQIVLALTAMNGLMARNPRTGGWIIGGALAVWSAISIEALPMAAAFLAVAALRWMRHRSEAGWFVHSMQALAVGSGLLFAATGGFGGSAQQCGAIAPVHLVVFALGALVATGLAALEPLPRPALAAGLGLTAATGVAILVALAPQCASSGLAGAGLPIWRQTPSLSLHIIVPPAIGLVACLQLAGRTGSWLRRFWLDYLLLLGAALALSLLDARWGAIAGALAAVPLGWRIGAWIRAARTMRRPGRRVLALAAMALALLPALPLTLVALTIPA